MSYNFAPNVRSGRNALHKAAFWGHNEMVKFLLEQKINPNQQDNYGDTPLHVRVLIRDATTSVVRVYSCPCADR